MTNAWASDATISGPVAPDRKNRPLVDFGGIGFNEYGLAWPITAEVAAEILTPTYGPVQASVKSPTT